MLTVERYIVMNITVETILRDAQRDTNKQDKAQNDSSADK